MLIVYIDGFSPYIIESLSLKIDFLLTNNPGPDKMTHCLYHLLQCSFRVLQSNDKFRTG